MGAEGSSEDGEKLPEVMRLLWRHPGTGGIGEGWPVPGGITRGARGPSGSPYEAEEESPSIEGQGIAQVACEGRSR